MPAWLTSGSFMLTLAAAVYLLAFPVYTGFDGTQVTHATLIQVNGRWVIVPVLFPAIVALAPVLFPHRVIRIIAAILIGGFAFLSGFSIGLFYLPAAVSMLMACISTPMREAH